MTEYERKINCLASSLAL